MYTLNLGDKKDKKLEAAKRRDGTDILSPSHAEGICWEGLEEEGVDWL
jgi:hypothetical protein